MFSPRRFKAVAQKEFLELKRNKLFFLMTVLAPTILYFLFAFGFSLDARNIPIGVEDLDKSQLSRQLIDRFANATDLFRIKEITGEGHSLERDMDLDRIRAIIVIPADFTENIKKGKPSTLQVIVDGTNPVYSNTINTYIDSIISSFQMDVLGEFFTKHGFGASNSSTPIDLAVSAWYNSSFRSEDFIIPGVVAIIIMFFPPLVAAISLAREKETGSILNMYCSSITKSEYLLGKMTPYIAISYLNCLLFIALSIFLFHVPMRGSFLLLVASGFFYVASAVAIGLLVAVIVNTQIAAILLTSILTLTPAFMYSGFLVPLSSLGESAKIMAYMLPATFFIDITRKIMVKGASFANTRHDVLITVIFAISIYALCIKLFRKRLG